MPSLPNHDVGPQLIAPSAIMRPLIKLPILLILSFLPTCPILANDPAPENPQFAASAGEPSAVMLLVDAASQPTLTISWTTNEGIPVSLTAQLPYASDNQRVHMGENIDAFVAVGGTRLVKGAGHPRGIIVRAGFYKHIPFKPFFADVNPHTEFTVTLEDVRFNQPIDVNPLSGVQHLKYAPDDILSCGLPIDAGEQFNTANPDDALNGRVRPDIDTRLGILDGSDASLGSFSITESTDDTASMTATFSYAALRNIRDPWDSTIPGTFLEPMHFHLEFEALPHGVPPLPPVPTTYLED